MNCLEFRRQLMQDPFDANPALQSHEQECPACAEFATQQRRQEGLLREVLNAPEAPAELIDNIQLAVHMEHRSLSRRRTWYAAAASVLLVIGATMTSLLNETWERGNMALAQSVINHIDDESHHLREAGPAPERSVSFVFRRFQAKLTKDIGPVNFAAECLMRNRNGVHLILPGTQGPVTVFFMPGEIPDKTVEVKSERFQGYIVPTDWGSVAVVGEQGEHLEKRATYLASAVFWPSV